jgi:hypothetical protein
VNPVLRSTAVCLAWLWRGAERLLAHGPRRPGLRHRGRDGVLAILQAATALVHSPPPPTAPSPKARCIRPRRLPPLGIGIGVRLQVMELIWAWVRVHQRSSLKPVRSDFLQHGRRMTAHAAYASPARAPPHCARDEGRRLVRDCELAPTRAPARVLEEETVWQLIGVGMRGLGISVPRM